MTHDRLRFGMTLPDEHAEAALADLVQAFGHGSAFPIVPIALPSYSAVFEAVQSGACDAAWAPPLVALDLARCEMAEPVVAVGRAWGTAYYSSIVVAPWLAVVELAQIAGLAFGWTNKQSASGYVVPRLHLAAQGFQIPGLFSRESFLGTHELAAQALVEGRVDAIATFMAPDMLRGTMVTGDGRLPARVLATFGPIPNDVVVARSDLGSDRVACLIRACLAARFYPDGPVARLTRIRRFEPLPRQHLAPLSAMMWRALRGGADAPLAAAP